MPASSKTIAAATLLLTQSKKCWLYLWEFCRCVVVVVVNDDFSFLFVCFFSAKAVPPHAYFILEL